MNSYTMRTSSPRRSFNNRLVICLVWTLCNGINGFQLSMVASRAPFGTNFDSSAKARSQNSYASSSQTSSGGVTSGLISNLAVVALKLRLKDQTHVSCDVTASSSNVLLRGQVGPVTVKGRGWQSRLGLSCRAMEATVDSCDLDMGRILANRKLVLTTPALGRAMVALNSVDFGNFITHPLMKPPGLPEVGQTDGNKLEFLKEGASVDHANGEVVFFGTYLNAKWKFTLARGANGVKAVITATPSVIPDGCTLDYGALAPQLAEITSGFFNEMVFELDGTYLSFGEMMVTGKGKEPTVMLSLSIKVRKFPSPGLEF